MPRSVRDVVKIRYKGVLPLEATCIAMAIRDKQWEDFRHTFLDRVIFTIASFFLRIY